MSLRKRLGWGHHPKESPEPEATPPDPGTDTSSDGNGHRTHLERELAVRQIALDEAVHETQGASAASYYGWSSEGFVQFRGLRYSENGTSSLERARQELIGPDGADSNKNLDGEGEQQADNSASR